MLETKSQKLGPSFSSHIITDLLHERTYVFTIRALYGGVEGPISTVYQKIGKTVKKWFESLGVFSRHFYVPEGQDPRMVTVLSVPTAVTPHVTPTVARTTKHTSTVPATKSRTTEKPHSHPRVTQSRQGTSRLIGTTALQGSGLLVSVLCSVQ